MDIGGEFCPREPPAEAAEIFSPNLGSPPKKPEDVPYKRGLQLVSIRYMCSIMILQKETGGSGFPFSSGPDSPVIGRYASPVCQLLCSLASSAPLYLRMPLLNKANILCLYTSVSSTGGSGLFPQPAPNISCLNTSSWPVPAPTLTISSFSKWI